MPRFDVTIAGEINLDLVLYGLPPEMPVERELLASDFQATLGSSSAITAHNLAALGAKTGFITRAGRDPLGAIAIERLAAIGVDLSRISYTQRGTSTGITILLHHGNERHILTYPGTMFEMSVKDLDLDYLASGRHFHLSSLFLHKSLHADLPGVFRTLKSAGLTLSLDTNDDPEDRWEGALDELLDLTDILLPNAQEACRIARKSDLEEAIELLSSRVPIVAHPADCGHSGGYDRRRRQLQRRLFERICKGKDAGGMRSNGQPNGGSVDPASRRDRSLQRRTVIAAIHGRALKSCHRGYDGESTCLVGKPNGSCRQQ